MQAKIKTVWEVRLYEVWGNAQDGYNVNDITHINRHYVMNIPVTIYNPNTPNEFMGAYPTDSQIRKALGYSRMQIECQGDDTHICVERARDGYPIGELFCLSHDSLSPIREAQNK